MPKKILAVLAITIASLLNAFPAGTPDDFTKAGLELWLSAGNVVPGEGGIIAVIKDQSGQSNDAGRNPTAMPATNPSLVKAAAGGQPVLRFSGSNVVYTFKPISDIRTVFWVVSKDHAAFGVRNEKFVLGDKDSNDFHAGWTDDTILNTDVNPGHLSKNLAQAKTWLNGRPVVANKTPFPKQLSLISIISTGPVKAGQLARDRNFSNRAWQGEIAEILIYNVALSDSDRQTVERYLMRKYALAN